MNSNGSPMGGAARAKAALGALSLVVVGAVLGVAIDRHLLLDGDYGAATSIHGSMARDFHDAMLSSLTQRLELSSEQRMQIDSIMTARHDVLLQTWEALHSRLGAAVDSVHRDVEAVLTPEQRLEFRAWAREMGGGS